MDFILDTHAFIWFINGEELPENVIDKIRDINNRCFLSIASIWEIAIKISLNKLTLQADFETLKEFISSNNIELLPISFKHLQLLTKLPYYHNDPFDRIIICQGIAENLPVLTKDSKFNLYNVVVVWN